jgi:monofunctional biosynthetic peptidoglycan transglycosylase
MARSNLLYGADSQAEASTWDAFAWSAVDDVVMGGVSASTLRVTPQGTALFTGSVSLANNGGFASVRSRPTPVDLSAYDGLELRVRGDGKRYQLRLRLDPHFDGIAYRAHFDTEPGRWQRVYLPFTAFEPTFRGRRPPGAPPLDPARIYTFGFLIAGKQAGDFALEIDWLRAYAGAADGA